jgi:copper ion binding protein
MKKLFMLAAAVLFSVTMIAANEKTVLRIKGMRCEECGHKVRNVLKGLDGIKYMTLDFERRTMTVEYDNAQTLDSIKARLEKTGRYKTSAYSSDEVIKRGLGFQIADMHCQKCVDRIMNHLSKLEGIDSLAPHLDKHYFFIRYDANRTCKDEIRALLNELGYTPCNYYTSPKIGWFYLILPAEQATEETMETVLALDGVEDVNVNPKRKSMAITYFNDEVKGERLLELIHQAGIKAEVPKPHVCEEEKKE